MPEIPPEFEERTGEGQFDQESRILTYEGDCSVRLLEKELNAARVLVRVRTSYVSFKPDTNKEYRPERSAYGRLTHWSGSLGVVKDSLLQYPSQILMDWRNEGMISRYWNTVLAELYFPIVKANALAMTESAPLAGLAGWSGFFDIALNLRVQELWATIAATGITDKFGENNRPILTPWGFAPPVWLWKFQQVKEVVWTEWIITCWYLKEYPGIAIAPPDNDLNEPNSESGGENSPVPNDPNNPPDPESQSPSDPRNDQGDYTSAEPPEPPEPPEPTLVRITVPAGAWGVTTGPNNTQLPGFPQDIPCGSALSQPPPTIAFDNNFNGSGFKCWVLEYTNAAGNRVKIPCSDQGFDRTPYGQPVIVQIDC